MGVGVVAVEQSVVAELVGQVDLSEVVTTAGGDRQARRDVEGVGRVKAGIERRGAQPDRRDVARRLVDERPRSLRERKLISIEGTKFGAFGELHQPTVDAQPDREIIPVIKHFSADDACTEPPELLVVVQVRSISPKKLVASDPLAGTV